MDSWWMTVIIAFSLLSLCCRADLEPYQLTWSNESFGPDGPWPAVQVMVGTPGTIINLYPGSVWESWIIEEGYCTLNSSNGCFASKAGTYDRGQGVLSKTGSDPISAIDSDLPSNDPNLADFVLGVDEVGVRPTRWMDVVGLSSPTGPGGLQQFISNTSLLLIEQQMEAYPSGQWYPFFAGCLSLGGAGVNQSFSVLNQPPINASLPPGWLWESGFTSSNSFGMHIGAISPRMPGSLWFGGYDKQRVSGNVLALNPGHGGNIRTGIGLKDISIEVVDGYSPFNFTSSVDGLLADGNSSIKTPLNVSIDGCSPYFSLPRSTCDNLASYLPVSYNDSLGLYLWDTTSPTYSEIISSASAISFTFAGDSGTNTLTIRVPFLHLNLTLSSPLVNVPTPYFPCYTGTNSYTLGRAFLQDAFLGANWHSQDNTWWLAQAPGPNIPIEPDAVSIEPNTTTISAGGKNWNASWQGFWSTSTPGASRPKTPTASNASSTSLLSTGAKIGIGIGVGVSALVLAAAGVALLMHWRRKKKRTPLADGAPRGSRVHNDTATYRIHEKDGESKGPFEVVGDHYKPWDPRFHGVAELPGSRVSRK